MGVICSSTDLVDVLDHDVLLDQRARPPTAARVAARRGVVRLAEAEVEAEVGHVEAVRPALLIALRVLGVDLHTRAPSWSQGNMLVVNNVLFWRNVREI